MLSLVILGTVYALCVAVFFWALVVAPRGFEDDGGFHFADEPSSDEYIDRPLVYPPAPKPAPQDEPAKH